MKRKFIALIVSVLFFNLSCAVTGPTVTRQEEEAARAQLKQADHLIWWKYQKRLLRVTDRFAWSVQAPEAQYRNSFGIWMVLRKSASADNQALFDSLGKPVEGTALHVSAGSPGERAGVSEGDVIVSIDDKNVSAYSTADLIKLAATGEPRKFSLKKHGENIVKSVTVTPAYVLDVTFYAFRSELINADAGPIQGVNVVRVYYGMLNLVESDDELASVLGHELVHILKDHYGKRSTIGGIGAVIALALAIAGAARGVDPTAAVKGVSDLTRMAQVTFSRDYEREADYLGLHLTHQAGFDANAATNYWERIAAVKTQSLTSNFQSTHPSTPERFVRIQKTIDEIRQGRTLQEVWFGGSSDSQVANQTPGPAQSPNPPAIASSAPIPAPQKNTPSSLKEAQSKNPITPTALFSPGPSSETPAIEKKPSTKTYASLTQYDGPRVKSGITLEAEFIDNGSGSGHARVVSPGNRYVIDGTWTTVQAEKVEAPKLIEKKALNALRLAADLPLTTSRFADNDTILECIAGETVLGQRKGECQDNYGNKYHLVFRP